MSDFKPGDTVYVSHSGVIKGAWGREPALSGSGVILSFEDTNPIKEPRFFVKGFGFVEKYHIYPDKESADNAGAKICEEMIQEMWRKTAKEALPLETLLVTRL